MSLRQLMQMQFYIPFYQRNYTWEDEHALALLNDFCDAVHRASNNNLYTQAHYLASFVLMNRQDNKNHKDIIDGQQRLTTIVMLLKAIALEFKDKTTYSNAINDIDGLLWPPGNNRNFILMSPANTNSNIPFLDGMLKGNNPASSSKTQKNMQNRFSILRSQLKKEKDDFLDSLYKSILASDLTDHYVNDIVEANRIFLTLNARGKPLTNFDKIKALLIYYAERIGKQTLANHVHQAFVNISQHYESIENTIDSEKIKLRADGPIDEDILLGWHYCTAEQAARLISAHDVYVKLELQLKGLTSNQYIEDAINQYISSAEHFFEHLAIILGQGLSSYQHYEAIVMCRFTALVWPLIITCNYRGFLNNQCSLPKGGQISLFRLIQIIDKMHRRGQFQGQALISLAYHIYNDKSLSAQDIADKLIGYHNAWSKQNYTLGSKAAAKEDDYFNYLLFCYAIPASDRNSVPKLRTLRKSNYVVAKILRSYVGVEVRNTHGYNSNANFLNGIEEIGNHVLLEGKCISGIETVEEKNGPRSPTELRQFLNKNQCRLPTDTTNEIGKLINDASIKKADIDNRTGVISQALDRDWEI